MATVCNAGLTAARRVRIVPATSPMRTRTVPSHRLVALACLLMAASAWAADDPINGRALFEDTPGVSGINNLTASCVNCHGSVENRRQSIGGSPYADLSFDTAMAHFIAAANGRPEMRQFLALSPQQARDIGAYIADTPKTSVAALGFDASAVNTATAVQTVDLSSAVATSESLVVVSVGLSGTGASRFSRPADTCTSRTIAPAASCRVSLTFSASDTAGARASLDFTLRQGTSQTTFTRSVALDGVVTVPAPASSGGGAFSAGWLAALGLAALLARRRA